MIVSRHGKVLNGDDIYNADGLGQQRSVVVEGTTRLQLRLQNDGTERDDFSICIPSSSNSPIDFRIFAEGRDASQIDPSICDPHRQLTRRVKAHKSVPLSLVIDVDLDAPLGERATALILASNGAAVDAVLIKVTKTSAPD